MFLVDSMRAPPCTYADDLLHCSATVADFYSGKKYTAKDWVRFKVRHYPFHDKVSYVCNDAIFRRVNGSFLLGQSVTGNYMLKMY